MEKTECFLANTGNEARTSPHHFYSASFCKCQPVRQVKKRRWKAYILPPQESAPVCFPSTQGLVEAFFWETTIQGYREQIVYRVEAGGRLNSATKHARDCASHSPQCASVVSSVKWGYNNSTCIVGSWWGFKELTKPLKCALAYGK